MSELSVGQLKGLTVNSNKITVPSGHTLYAPGHVLYSDSVRPGNTITTSQSYQPWATLTVTPKSSSSKVLCSVNISQAYIDTARGGIYLSLYRNGTSIQTVVIESQAAAACLLYGSFEYYDSPASTSLVTYEVKFKCASGTGYIQSGGTSSFTIKEVAV